MADHVRVLVVGEFKQGKSLLVNALVGAPVCPVHDDIATSVATVVTHAPSPVLTVTAQAPDSRSTGSSRRVRRIDVPLEAMADAVAAHVTEWGNPGNRHGVVQVGVYPLSRRPASLVGCCDTHVTVTPRDRIVMYTFSVVIGTFRDRSCQ